MTTLEERQGILEGAKMKADELAALLVSHSLFADCDSTELSEIILRGRYTEYKKNDFLVRQGDSGDSLIIILDGIARTSMVASNGREIVLDYAEAGHVIGEIALLDGGERTADVVAVEEIGGLLLTRDAFETILSMHNSLGLRLLKVMARRLRLMNTMIESDRAFTSGPRLARYLIRLLVEGADEGHLKLDLNQSELGNFAGMSREHINRQLSAWSEAKIIAVEQGKVRVLDVPTLLEIAESAS